MNPTERESSDTHQVELPLPDDETGAEDETGEHPALPTAQAPSSVNNVPVNSPAAEATLDQNASEFQRRVFGDGKLDYRQARSNVVRRPPLARFCAIDVGTNSIHLVLAEITPEGDFRIVGRDKDMVQLGKGGFKEHVLTPRAINEGLSALGRFVKMARLKDTTRLKAFATSAVREAHNGGEFVRRAEEELGLDLNVISAEEEARLIYLAVRHAMALGERDNLIVDIGGGSVELIVGNAHRAEILGSVKLGASRLGELFIHSDPPKETELKALRRHIEDELEVWTKRVGQRDFARLIGTSGTIRSIAGLISPEDNRLELKPAAQLRFSRSELKTLHAKLVGLKRDERLKIPGMESRRADMVLPGVILVMTLMKSFGVESLEHCDMGMREGIILDHIARNRAHLLARATWPNPRTRSVIHLAERCGYQSEHAAKVAELVLSMFDQLQELHKLPVHYRELLKYAALLQDIGYHISYRGHHKHSYYLIRNGELKGFSDQEIEIIANIARYHRKERPKKSHYSFRNLDGEHRGAVKMLSVLLRLANTLDRTHYSVAQSLTCRVLENRVELIVHTEKDAELELWTAKQKSPLFEREFGLSLHLRLATIQFEK